MGIENIYQHFHLSERTFIDRCLEWINQVEESYSVITTRFLNPREVQILEILGNQREIQIFSSQMLAQTELSKIILAPSFYILDESDFDLSLLEIHYPSKFVQLSHSQVLGTFLGQTGVNRQELGDIVVTEKVIQVFVSQHLVEVFQSIDKIGRSTVRINEIPPSQFLQVKSATLTEVVLVSSLRIDSLISAAFNISRNLASSMLESNKIKTNYLEISKRDYLLNEGDLISVRGYGRIKITKILNRTKKNKQRVEIEVIKNRKK